MRRSAKFALCLNKVRHIEQRPYRRHYVAPTTLFLLMTIFSQTFLAFVSSHLVAFSFLSAGHVLTLLVGY